jgi:hypothetical protein
MYVLLVLLCLRGGEDRCDYVELRRYDTSEKCSDDAMQAATHGQATNQAGDRILGYLCQSAELVEKANAAHCLRPSLRRAEARFPSDDALRCRG